MQCCQNHDNEHHPEAWVDYEQWCQRGNTPAPHHFPRV
ncbi:hypothetical protein E2C01_097031 [Portunus trituberculatus]|uniref:Uncharacterized protein n=1 Tax=Portunus trituberculatus TaxID=210409 RepID=A0A5B7K8W1_PORTR|nr:hypothetical protein [Portunus trituberculatus]